MCEKKKKLNPAEELTLEAEYDIETAFHLYKTGRYPYVVFMRHLSIEKALKSVFTLLYNETPPKTHNLLYLLKKNTDKFDIQFPRSILSF